VKEKISFPYAEEQTLIHRVIIFSKSRLYSFRS